MASPKYNDIESMSQKYKPDGKLLETQRTISVSVIDHVYFFHVGGIILRVFCWFFFFTFVCNAYHLLPLFTLKFIIQLDRNRDLVQRFEEQNLQMREMNREVVDLRQSLHMTTKGKPKFGVKELFMVQIILSHIFILIFSVFFIVKNISYCLNFILCAK